MFLATAALLAVERQGMEERYVERHAGKNWRQVRSQTCAAHIATQHIDVVATSPLKGRLH